jgi:hypothetical protein
MKGAAAPHAASSPAQATGTADKTPGVAPEPAAAPLVAKTVTISISSEPTGATVSQPGSPTILGVTPIELSFARAAEGLIFRVAKPGYVEGTLKVVPDADKPALVTLAMNTPAASAPPPAATMPPRSPSHNGKKVRNALPMDPFSK